MDATVAVPIVVAVLLGGSLAVWYFTAYSTRQVTKRRQQAIDDDIEAGRFEMAARKLLDIGDVQRSVALFERAQRFTDAGRAAMRMGDVPRAVMNFERGGDYKSAAACYLKLGDDRRRLDALDRAGLHSEAAVVAERIGDYRRAAELKVKAGDAEAAVALFTRMGDVERARFVAAKHLEATEHFADAAIQYEAMEDWESAIRCWDAHGDVERVADISAQLGRHEVAAQMYEQTKSWLKAAACHEALHLFRKAAAAYQRGGLPDRALNCMELEGDKVAVMKLRIANGEYEDAIRTAKTVPNTDPTYKDIALLVAEVHQLTNQPLDAAEALMEALGAGLQPRLQVQAAIKAAEIYAEARMPRRGRAALELASRVVEEVPELHQRVNEIAERLDALPEERASAFEIPDLSEASRGGRPSLAEAFPLDQDASQPILGAGGQDVLMPLDRPIDHPTEDFGFESVRPQGRRTATPPGWPQGVPVQLAERYSVPERIGAGGNGVVYRATDVRLGRPVVLKFMVNQSLPSDVARRYFLREVQTAAALNHPNIVHIYDTGELEGVHYFSMEFVEGEPLTSYLRKNQPMQNNVFLLSVAEQLAEALEHAHNRGVVHRDIKPGNVLVGRDGTVKLADFGLARVIEESSYERSIICGTPYYMSPEQIEGKTVDRRADVYSFGVLLFQMLTGELPFSEGNVFVAHCTKPVPNPLDVNPDLPPAASEILLKCLQKNPAKRYQGARQVARDLRQALLSRLDSPAEALTTSAEPTAQLK